MRSFLCLLTSVLALFSSGCASHSAATPGFGVRAALLAPGVHGRLTGRTMSPQYITIHSTQNPGATAANHATLLLRDGRVSKNNPRFGRSGWITWHFTVDDREAVEHLLPTEQGDHADYGGIGDRQSIGIEICEFRDSSRQAAAISRAARLAAALADQYHIPQTRIVPHMHWSRWDYPHGKPCPTLLLTRDPKAPGGWREGDRWQAFLAQVQHLR